MTINDIQRISPKELTILTMSKEERKKAKIKTTLPYLTPDEMQLLSNKLLFARFIMLEGKKSMGRTEYDMENQSKDLQNISEWINLIQVGISAAQSAKQDGAKSVALSTECKEAMTNIAIWAKKEKLTVDIELHEGIRKDGRPYFYSTLKQDPSELIEQFQRISHTLNAQIKNISTQVQKLQSDHNTHIEMISTTSKRYTDTNISAFNKM